MLQLVTLGRLTLDDGERQLLVGRRKVLALLTYLVRRDGQRISRATLADLLWPDVDEHRSKQSLRTALTELRAAVGEALQADGDSVVVPHGLISTDVARMSSDIARREFAAATAWWHGEFLAGLEDLGHEEWRAWLDAERSAARKQLDWAFEHLVAECETAGRWSDAIAHAERWAAARPGHEGAASRLVAALRSAGRTGEAAARHAALSRTLLDANGVVPSASFAALASTFRADVIVRPGIRGLLTPELVGRDDELGLLSSAWARASRGAGCCVVVEGDEGLGKTRLVEEFGRTLRASKAAIVMQSRAFASEHAQPSSLLRVLLEQLADAPGLGAAPAAVLATLGLISEPIRERFASAAASAETHPDAFARALADVAFETPVALLIDDVAVGDPASLRALETVIRRPPPHVLVVLTGRPNTWEAWPAVNEVAGAAHVMRCVLTPLSLAHTRRLIESVGPIDAAIVGSLSERLHNDAHGRPGVVELLVRGLADAGTLIPDASGRWTLSSDAASWSIPVPAEISETVRARLTGLPDETRRVLECAAVVGPRIDPTVLETAGGLSPERFRTATADLFARRLLRNSAAGAGRLEFFGEAERRAVYEQIVPSTRRAMHRAAAKALRTGAADDAQRALLREHEQLAGVHRSRRSVFIAAALAIAVIGVIAMRRVTASRAEMPEGTQVLLANVHNLTSDSSLGPTLDLAARVGLQRSAQVRLFPQAQIRESIARMKRAVPPAGLDERLAQEVAIRENLPAFIHLAIAAVDSAFVITGRVVEPNQSRDLFSTDVRANGRGDILPSLDVVLTRVRTALGESRFDMQRQPALPLVTTSSLDALRYYVVGNRAWAAGRRFEAKDAWLRAIQLDSAFSLVYQSLGLYYYFQGDSGIDRSRGDYYYDRAIAHAERLTERERLALDASIASQRGTQEDAITKLRRLAERFPESETWYNLGSVLMRNRRLDEAAEALRRSIQFDSTAATGWINLATVHSMAGRVDSALYAYDRAAAIGSDWLVRGGNVNQEWGALLLRAGRIAAAESLYRGATTMGDADERSLALRSLGWLAMYQGRYREASSLLEQAVGLSASQSGGLSTARNGWILATALLELGDTTRARSELARAEAALGALETAPVFVFYLANSHLQAGNVRAAVRLRARIERSARGVNNVDQSSLAFLNGLTALSESRHDSAIVWARRGDAVYRETNFPDLILARAYEAIGPADSAIAAAKRLETRWQFGFEAQRAWRHAGLRLGRLALKAGDTVQARAALERQLAVWKDADVDLPDLVETRRLLTRLTTTR